MKYLLFLFCFFQTTVAYAAAEDDDTKAFLSRLVILVQQSISTGEYILVLVGMILFILGLLYLKNQNKNNYPIHYILLVIFVGVMLVKPMACSNSASRSIMNQETEMETRLDNIETNNGDGSDFSFNGE